MATQTKVVECGMMRRGPVPAEGRRTSSVHLVGDDMDWLQDNGYRLSATLRILLRRFRKAKESKQDFILINSFDQDSDILR